jgi:hypothetical protein
MNLMLKAPGTKRLKLEYDILLSSVFAFKFNLRRYSWGGAADSRGTADLREVG